MSGAALVVHVPHTSTFMPEETLGAFLLPRPELERVASIMGDLYTDELFAYPSATMVVAPVSRLIVDVERFEDDGQEAMASCGMGVIYTVTHDGQRLRPRLETGQREALLDRWYRPHHARLEAAVTEVLAASGSVLLVDAHSFPSRPLPYEDDQRSDRPEICIGSDEWHTPAGLADAAVAWFAREGFTVALNRPFAGSLVPMSRYRKDRRVLSLMVEVRRDLYLEEGGFGKGEGFGKLREVLGRFLGWIHTWEGMHGPAC